MLWTKCQQASRASTREHARLGRSLLDAGGQREERRVLKASSRRSGEGGENSRRDGRRAEGHARPGASQRVLRRWKPERGDRRYVASLALVSWSNKA